MKLCEKEKQLEKVANQLRIDTIKSLGCAGSGHPGGSLSIAEILAVLYFHEMDVDPQHPHWEERDRLVLSKGHAAPIYYAALARRGFFSPNELVNLRKAGSFLQGHPDSRKTPGVDASTGSLGQGISIASGMALYAKKKEKNFRVFCVLGDGELQEGQVWEAFMSAAHKELTNLRVIIDYNGLQIDGSVDSVMSLDPIMQKLKAFGWQVDRCNGHDISALLLSLHRHENTDAPFALICDTVKGKGISFMENRVEWHGAPLSPEQCRQAIEELSIKG